VCGRRQEVSHFLGALKETSWAPQALTRSTPVKNPTLDPAAAAIWLKQSYRLLAKLQRDVTRHRASIRRFPLLNVESATHGARLAREMRTAL
jgi:hypothetical protein